MFQQHPTDLFLELVLEALRLGLDVVLLAAASLLHLRDLRLVVPLHALLQLLRGRLVLLCLRGALALPLLDELDEVLHALVQLVVALQELFVSLTCMRISISVSILFAHSEVLPLHIILLAQVELGLFECALVHHR